MLLVSRVSQINRIKKKKQAKSDDAVYSTHRREHTSIPVDFHLFSPSTFTFHYYLPLRFSTILARRHWLLVSLPPPSPAILPPLWSSRVRSPIRVSFSTNTDRFEQRSLPINPPSSPHHQRHIPWSILPLQLAADLG